MTEPTRDGYIAAIIASMAVVILLADWIIKKLGRRRK